jgi:ribosome-interacting GTPase 1
MHNYDRKLHLNEKDIAAITKTYNFVRERNLIRKDLNLDEIIDDTYIKQALGDPS